MATSRCYQDLRDLAQSKVPRDPDAQGRLSLIGVCMTMIDCIIPWMIWLLLPCLLLQKLVHHGRYESLELVCDSSEYPPVPTYFVVYLVLEVLFHVSMRIKLAYLQAKDPLVESLKAGGIMSLTQRKRHWNQTMNAVSDNPSKFFQDWFFGTKMEDLSIKDLRNFVAWSCFEGRLVEHLSPREMLQLDTFVRDALLRTNHPRQSQLQESREVASSTPVLQSQISLSETSCSTTDSLSDESSLSSASSLRPADEDELESTDQQELIQNRAAIHKELLWRQLRLQQSKPIPEAQLAELMRNVTDSHAASESAAPTCIIQDHTRARRFKHPTVDPILGVRIAPLFVHVTFVLFSHVLGSMLLWILGFQKYQAGSMTYCYRSGNQERTTPLVFIHGIGVGPIAYVVLIFQMIMMTSGRPVFLPELPTVSVCRPWVMPSACLSPQQVATSLSMMLANHGFAKATFSGHSFGTFWMTYLVKYAPSVVAGLVFVDPVNFCLYDPLLADRNVYNEPDPGNIGYLIHTDMMVCWSIQRNLCLMEGNLFVEDIPQDIPVAVFVSGEDKIAPSKIQQTYLQKHRDCKVQKFEEAKQKKPWETHDLSVTVFDGCDHGMWLLDPQYKIPPLIAAMESLTDRTN
ncbi:expressed unknown protein [Seminavis robusta]|uniref:AB hydrolase-1 domain-containing protein n=1 Tax=Seminavis robusta TaxID=568900 RepID=A0A9N8DM34_9STRA|nr:expressed unknown protein [Seminavis robusta]|eukprot:Sro131_g062210.1 n/a (630) ;mRNA; f:36646-38647